MKERIMKRIAKLILKNYFIYLLFLWLFLFPVDLICEILMEAIGIAKETIRDCLSLSSKRFFQDNKERIQ